MFFWKRHFGCGSAECYTNLIVTNSVFRRYRGTIFVRFKKKKFLKGLNLQTIHFLSQESEPSQKSVEIPNCLKSAENPSRLKSAENPSRLKSVEIPNCQKKC